MKYTYDKDYFEKIDTEDKAYFLGLLYADGYNFDGKSRYFSLSLQIKDKHILEDFQKYLKSNYPLKLVDGKGVQSDQIRLQVNGKKISKDLDDLGCIRNKTNFLTFPTKDKIPSNLLRHFIRGYFDGDGSVWEGKRHRCIVKDKTYKSGYRERIIHNVKFNFTGTIDIIQGIQRFLNSNISLPINKINTSKNIENCVQLEYSGRGQMKKLYDLLYNQSNVYFKRKKDKFESIICANT